MAGRVYLGNVGLDLQKFPSTGQVSLRKHSKKEQSEHREPDMLLGP